MLDSMDVAAVHRWCALGLAALRRHQHEIDELNVFPVPDGDTGTNLVLTVAAAEQALLPADDTAPTQPASDPARSSDPARLGGDQAPPVGEPAQQPSAPAQPPVGATPLGRTLRQMARGALLGARGNSGVIVAQLFMGIAEELAVVPTVRGLALAAALDRAATTAYAAVAAPVEGTLLSVARAAAQAAREVDSDELATVVRAAAAGAVRALDRTPEQLPALARAGVVDAGGRGLVLLLEALVEVVTGTVVAVAPTGPVGRRPIAVVREAGSASFEYEVQYLLDAPEPAVETLRERLAGLGDSLVVIGAGDDTWNVHVHVNDAGAAIEAGIAAGRPHRISVTRFAAPAPPVDPRARGAVVVVSGAGLADLFRAEGAVVVAGPSPSTGELLAAIRATGAGQVVLLPNDRNAHPVAAMAASQAREEGIRAGVVPTRSPVQALAALAVRDLGRRFEDDLIAMADAAGACRFAEVCTASREAVTVAGLCLPGDVLALVENEVNLIGSDLRQTCRDLVDRLLAGGGELVTLVTGGDAPDDLGEVLCAHLSRHWPFVEVQLLAGGQPRYPLLVGVE